MGLLKLLRFNQQRIQQELREREWRVYQKALEIWKEREKTSLEWYEASVRYWQWEALTAAVPCSVEFSFPLRFHGKAGQSRERSEILMKR